MKMIATRTVALMIFTLGVILLTGCQGAVGEPPAKSAAEKSTAETPTPQTSAVAVHNIPAETWDAMYIQGAKVGYEHRTRREIDEAGRKLLSHRSESQLTMKRFSGTVTMNMNNTCITAADGKLVRFDSKMTVGPQPVLSQGKVVGDQLKITTDTQGKSIPSSIKWDGHVGGFYALDESLLAQPIKPGETRNLRQLMPILNEVASVRLVAQDWEETKLLDGPRKLLKVNCVMEIADNKLENILWLDRAGTMLKTEMPSMNQVSYRTVKEVALAKDEAVSFDLGEQSIVKVRGKLPRPHETRQVTYRVKMASGDPAAAFATGVSQQVKSIDPHTAEVKVIAVRPGRPEKLDVVAEPKPTDEDLASNNLIQSDDVRVMKLAQQALPDEKDPWKIALALESLIHRSIRKKNFSTAFATAAEVAQSLEGDCTEHAVLLAATLRARKIPARVAMGLVWFSDISGPVLGYHMWTEAWIGDRWVPLDATVALGGIGGGHLKLGDSNLKGASAYTAFLPVVRVMGQIEVEVLGSE